MEYYKKRVLELEAEEKRRRISQRKKDNERDRHVRADHRAADDLKAKSKVPEA